MKHIVIPARFSSSRLPGKPLLLIHNRPMILRVVDQAKKSKVLMICAWQQMTNVLLRSAVQMELM